MTKSFRIIAIVLSVTLPSAVFAKSYLDVDSPPPKTHMVQGAIAGAGIGVGLGAIFDGAMSAAVSSDSNTRTAAALLLVPLGAGIIGCGIGALIGHSMPVDDSKKSIHAAPMIDPQTGTKGMMVQGTF